jgi:hypothetical protein
LSSIPPPARRLPGLSLSQPITPQPQWPPIPPLFSYVLPSHFNASPKLLSGLLPITIWTAPRQPLLQNRTSRKRNPPAAAGSASSRTRASRTAPTTSAASLSEPGRPSPCGPRNHIRVASQPSRCKPTWQRPDDPAQPTASQPLPFQAAKTPIGRVQLEGRPGTSWQPPEDSAQPTPLSEPPIPTRLLLAVAGLLVV